MITPQNAPDGIFVANAVKMQAGPKKVGILRVSEPKFHIAASFLCRRLVSLTISP